ncbi:hypothetical protein B0P06_002906 [Clostridium saccharoperbutylacetonicum]|jgi:hypothetical protein|uniref:Uncharacterized protein n=1 Tax=Clostridium saccharoperbutylacetonicum N1-4(HMT) TaxID=931276 RepID=M1LZS4_9CLOT|nr:hypothetical protein [Clostridium saccharoperbutylacetonicum]AGF58775.1 hypothetical protein Cspa_c50220 [Clostridium saccharoperbutylacetonicum N1-4(HMT)]NRT60446.1 hypothetical protein [Clostridium saccharoperbutylacetonicum]NSB23759.1 hypothetical protein [Clostridium saccharoperbutylacetonicum]NSB43135.1 hypothetical protein [Clostridium saccharoperbutylacetonicum]
MNEIQKNDLFYVCSLIEFMGRKTKNRRSTIVKIIGKKELKRQLELAEVNHCLSFEEVSDEIIKEFNIKEGSFDSVGLCKYAVPSVQAIGKEYQRLIIDVLSEENNVIDVLYSVFESFISDEISDFNSSVYYSSPEYLKYSYLEGKLLA